MFGMLKIIFGRDRIAGGLGITRKLEIFLRHVIGRSANFHIGAVRLVNPRQRIVMMSATTTTSFTTRIICSSTSTSSSGEAPNSSRPPSRR